MNISLAIINTIVLIIFSLTGCASTLPMTPLLDATQLDDLGRIEDLLNKGEDINGFGGKYGETPLMAASRRGNIDIVKLLLSMGAGINARGAYGDTALIAAAWTCKADILRYLIANGADVNAQNAVYGSTALNIVAGKCSDTEIVSSAR